MEFDVVTTKEEISSASTKVENVGDGMVYLVMRLKSGIVKRCFIEPEDAVKLYRCFIGETNSVIIQYRTVKERDAVPEKMSAVYLDDRYLWDIKMKGLSFCLNADQTLALAWAIKKAVCIALYNDQVQPVQDNDRKSEDKTSAVWILVSSSRPGPISLNKEFCESLGVNAMAFSSKESALEHLREFLREEVNKCHDDIHWEELQDHGRTVDDIIDDILESGSDEQGVWMYDGTERSFSVELMKTGVK